MTSRSSSDARRPAVVNASVRRFAQTGYFATTIADVAHEAGLSPAYVSKLFGSKERLFVAALDSCFDRVIDALESGAESAVDSDPTHTLERMGYAYAHLMADRPVLLVQVHAQSVADIDSIGAALRHGIRRVTVFAQERSRADDEAVQRFMAYGQLCHLIVTAHLDSVNEEHWTHVLANGIRHPLKAVDPAR